MTAHKTAHERLITQVREAIWDAFEEQVCVDRSLNRICDTGDHDFSMTKVAEAAINAMLGMTW